MPIWKRFKGKRVKHGSKDYTRATWIVQFEQNGKVYKKAHPECATREQAETKEQELRAAVVNGELDFHQDKTTFTDYVQDVYLPFVRANNPSWENNKKFQIQRLCRFFADTFLKQITRARCEEYKRRRALDRKTCQLCANFVSTCLRCRDKKTKCAACEKKSQARELHIKAGCQPPPVSPATVKRDLVCLSHIFTLAVRDRRIRENPMRFVTMPKDSPARTRTLSLEEKNRLYSALANRKQLLAIVMLALTTGWRKGQILNLTKEAIDTETQTVLRPKSKQQLATKMPVNDLAFALLVKLSETVESGFLFRNGRTGEQLKSFYDSWWAACKEADLQNLKFHDLRATAATDLIRLGVDLLIVKDVLGHSKITTTQIYTRMNTDDLREGLNKLGENYQNYVM